MTTSQIPMPKRFLYFLYEINGKIQKKRDLPSLQRVTPAMDCFDTIEEALDALKEYRGIIIKNTLENDTQYEISQYRVVEARFDTSCHEYVDTYIHFDAQYTDDTQKIFDEMED